MGVKVLKSEKVKWLGKLGGEKEHYLIFLCRLQVPQCRRDSRRWGTKSVCLCCCSLILPMWSGTHFYFYCGWIKLSCLLQSLCFFLQKGLSFSQWNLGILPHISFLGQHLIYAPLCYLALLQNQMHIILVLRWQPDSSWKSCQALFFLLTLLLSYNLLNKTISIPFVFFVIKPSQFLLTKSHSLFSFMGKKGVVFHFNSVFETLIVVVFHVPIKHTIPILIFSQT